MASSQTSNDKPTSHDTKVDANMEEFLKKELIMLDNGKSHPMLVRIFTNTYWTYLCFPCQATCLSEVFLQSHLKGKRHTIQLLAKSVWPAHIIENHPYYIRKKNPLPKKEKKEANAEVVIAPGEPLPPGMEEAEEVIQISLLEVNCKDIKMPLIGLEYLMEIHNVDYDSKDPPGYFCGSCQVKGDSNTIVKHILGYRHRIRYLVLHFPKTYNTFQQSNARASGKITQIRASSRVIEKVCLKIEEKYGRLKPLIVSNDSFESKKNDYLTQVKNAKHFTEQESDKFDEIILQETEALEKIESTTTETKNLDKAKAGKLEKKDVKMKKIPTIEPTRGRYKNSSKNTSKSRKQGSLDSISSLSDVTLSDDDLFIVLDSTGELEKPKNTSTTNMDQEKIKIPLNDPKAQISEKVKWAQYRVKMKEFQEDAQKKFEYNEQFPEKHPCYQAEWKKFWNKKCRELQAVNKDILKVDLKPEWIEFWSVKMKELHSESLENHKNLLLKQLGLEPEPKPIDSVELNNMRDKERSNRSRERASRKSNERSYHRGTRQRTPDRRVIRSPERRGQGRLPSRRSAERSHSRRSSERNINRRSPERINSRRSNERNFDRRSPERTNFRRSNERNFDRRSPERRRSREKSSDRIRGMERRKRDRFGDIDERESKHRRQKSPSPAKQLSDEDRKWKIFHERMATFSSRYRSTHDEYIKHPETHPLYENEWLKFQNNRTDFDDEFEKHAEWERIWREKLKNFRDDEIQAKKVSLMKEIGIEMESKVEKNIEKEKRKSPNNTKYGNRSHVPPMSTEDLNVVIVLRHLTALENYLGSLGPKVVDMLGTVLKMEKEKANSSDDILLDDDYCVFLETVKEKLKGQLLADLIDSNAKPAAKVAIQYIATLVHKAGNMVEKMKMTQAGGIGGIDKAVIANQIATVLIEQGKTDVTTEELEALINSVVGMASSSQASFNNSLSSRGLLNHLAEMRGETTIAARHKQFVNDANTQMRGLPAAKPVESPFMDKLSDADLKTLLQNFKDLSPEEQNGLITYLKKLESANPQRVEQLRKFIDMGSSSDVPTQNIGKEMSPFSSRTGIGNPVVCEGGNKVSKMSFTKSQDSEDDEDFNDDEVIKSASEKIKERQFEEEMKIITQSIQDSTKSETASQSMNPKPRIEPNEVPNKESDNNEEFDTQSLVNVLNIVKNSSEMTNLLKLLAPSNNNNTTNQQVNFNPQNQFSNVTQRFGNTPQEDTMPQRFIQSDFNVHQNEIKANSPNISNSNMYANSPNSGNSQMNYNQKNFAKSNPLDNFPQQSNMQPLINNPMSQIKPLMPSKDSFAHFNPALFQQHSQNQYGNQSFPSENRLLPPSNNTNQSFNNNPYANRNSMMNSNTNIDPRQNFGNNSGSNDSRKSFASVGGTNDPRQSFGGNSGTNDPRQNFGGNSGTNDPRQNFGGSSGTIDPRQNFGGNSGTNDPRQSFSANNGANDSRQSFGGNQLQYTGNNYRGNANANYSNRGMGHKSNFNQSQYSGNMGGATNTAWNNTHNQSNAWPNNNSSFNQHSQFGGDSSSGGPRPMWPTGRGGRGGNRPYGNRGGRGGIM